MFFKKEWSFGRSRFVYNKISTYVRRRMLKGSITKVHVVKFVGLCLV
jgi:hypothetical protein